MTNMTLTGKMAAIKKISDVIFAEWHIFIFLIFGVGAFDASVTDRSLFFLSTLQHISKTYFDKMRVDDRPFVTYSTIIIPCL